MPNRADRRAAAAGRRGLLRKAPEKLRCIACERVGREMTKEHLWPRWIVQRAHAEKDPFTWIDGVKATPNKAVIPLCGECNHLFGREIEGPVATAFDDLEGGRGLTGRQCAQLVRWLWKFEGLFWCWTYPHGRYSDLWTVAERVTGQAAIRSVADQLSLGVGLINAEDRDGIWPVGVDSPIGEQGICVAGVFSRVALAVSFTDLVPAFVNGLDFQPLSKDLIESDEKVFFPSTRFPTPGQAIDFMKVAGPIAATVHERAIKEAKKTAFVHPSPRRRVELPH